MSELRSRSSILADFAQGWLEKGGPECSTTNIMANDINPRLVVVCRRDGDWYYEFTGELHDQINGFRLNGRVADRVPPHVWARTKTMFDRCVETHRAQMVESTGHIGRSIDLLIKTLRVECSAPAGADAAIAIAWDWKFTMDPGQEELLGDLVGRCAGTKLRTQFLSDRPGVARVSAQLALLREIVEGAYGCMDLTDRTYLQVFFLSLHSEFDTDGHALYRVH